MKTYRPLPDYLTIYSSDIDGLGLFAKEEIFANFEIGITHYNLWDRLVRTPLGGFINHSEDPNCQLIRRERISYLKTIKEIKSGEELTLKYETYEVMQ